MSIKSKYLPIIAFAILGIIWGSNFIYMKLASKLISPTQIVFLRVFFGLIPVATYAACKGALKKSHARHIHHFTVMGLLATVLYYIAYAEGTKLLPSGIAGAISGSIPLFACVLATAFIPEEKLTPLKITGVAIGLTGVILIGNPANFDIASGDFKGLLYMIAGSLSVGSSFVYARKFITPLRIPAAALATYQLSTGFIILCFLTDYSTALNIFSDTHASIGLILGLGLLGTGVAYILYYYIVDTMGAVSASSSTYLPPVVALLIGALLVGEDITMLDYAGTVCIFCGVFLLKR